MAAERWLITGATGLVGGNLAQACVDKGIEVLAQARASSDTRHLESIGVRIVRGDLAEPETLVPAVEEANVIVHCAAKVGDWGPVDDYRKVNVDGLRHLFQAAVGKVRRFMHLSTLGVYQAVDHFGTDETTPIPDRHMDGYTQSKVEAERLVLQYHRDRGLPVVVLRPGFVYGPRDRTVMPRLLDMLRDKKVMYIGSGEQVMNTIYVGNLIDAIFLAAEKDGAVGQIYNLTDGEKVSKRRFIETIADLAGLERPQKSVPRPVAKIAAAVAETIAKLRGSPTAPRVTRARYKFMGLNLDFSIEKARRELGYDPKVPFDEAMKQTIAWWKENQAGPKNGSSGNPAAAATGNQAAS